LSVCWYRCSVSKDERWLSVCWWNCWSSLLKLFYSLLQLK
jgi:hypothetical protein